MRRSNPLKKKSTAGSNSTTTGSSSSTTPSKVLRRLKSLNNKSTTTTDISTTTDESDSNTTNATAVAVPPSSSLDYLDGEPPSLTNIPESPSVHIDDTSESGSVQVNLVDGSSPTSNKEVVVDNNNTWCCGVNDVIHTLGLSANIEYNDDNVINNNSEPIENRDEMSGIEVEKDVTEDQLRDTNMEQQLSIINEKKTAKSGSKQPTAGGSDDITQSTTGGSSKKKSRMGSIFSKKGNKKGDGDKDEEDDEQPPNDQKGDDKKDDEDDDDKKKKSPTRRISSLTTFSTERQNFAIQSTLPIHTGSESTAPKSSPSWTSVTGTEFKVRHGPNYTKTGKKDNSLESLYDVYCVRFYRSEKRTKGGATRIMPLPGVEDDEGVIEGGDEVKADTGDKDKAAAEGGEDVDDLMSIEDTTDTTAAASSTGGKHYPELDGTKVPDVLVVHFMLPYEPPNMFKQKDDGPGGECVYYLKPSQRFLDEIAGRIPKTPATTLFINWCNECESNIQMRSRFKCMALVRDIDKHNFGLLKSYNGKPVLITESGRASGGYHGDVRYLEMTANGKFLLFGRCKY